MEDATITEIRTALKTAEKALLGYASRRHGMAMHAIKIIRQALRVLDADTKQTPGA